MQEIVTKSVRRVEVIFRQGEGTSGSRGPSIDQRRLQDLVSFAGATDEGAAVFDHNLHFRAEVEVVAIGGKLLAHDDIGDDRVDLNAGDVFAAGSKSPRDIPAAAGPNDQRLRPWPEQVRKWGRGKPGQIFAGALDGRSRNRE